jgi:hypothetical protein
MINKLEQLKENFAKYEQGFCKLVTGECLCAEAILAISNGLIIKKQYSFSDDMVYEEENSCYFEFSIPSYHYTELNLPKYITKIELLWWAKKLQLTSRQIDMLQSLNSLISWANLNDIVRLTFPQFILLLDILNKL